nr:hypothetical protein [uncultured Arsenicibacter sp.]
MSFSKLLQAIAAFGIEKAEQTNQVNLCGVLGIVGESSEALAETIRRNNFIDSKAIHWGSELDKEKKTLWKTDAGRQRTIKLVNEHRFDVELADLLFCLCLAMVSRGHTIDSLSELMLTKVIERNPHMTSLLHTFDNGWRDMESAPKDGSRILVLDKYENIMLVA